MKKLLVLVVLLCAAVGCAEETSVTPTATAQPTELPATPTPQETAVPLTATPLPTATVASISSIFIDQPVQIGDTIPSELLLAELEIFKEALESLHPSLYRHTEKETIDQHFAQLEVTFQEDLTLSEVFMAYATFLAQIKDGHTYTNFFNQPPSVQQTLFHQANKLPFTFRIFDNRMLIAQNASTVPILTLGVEVLSIDGVPVGEIFDTLRPYVKADGANDNKRTHDLQIFGVEAFEWFDVLHPLFFPPENEEFIIEAVDLVTGETFTTNVRTTSIIRRTATLSRNDETFPNRLDDLWQYQLLDGNIAYLKLGTFTVWNFQMDWEQFLADAFINMKEQGVEHLIIDIRSNEGGLDAVIEQLIFYLGKDTYQVNGYEGRTIYQTFPESLNPYLDTFDRSARDLSASVSLGDNGFYTFNEGFEPNERVPLPDNPNRFMGETYLLVNAGNSSATFLMAQGFQTNNLATLVGQETGGNLMGTSGGQFAFLRLPHSKIEIDIPLLGNYPLTLQPDSGLTPDVGIVPTVEDFIEGVDTELKAVLSMIEDQ
ncbi:MAG: S41 family peptidase [Chloroflexota bacterium]